MAAKTEAVPRHTRGRVYTALSVAPLSGHHTAPEAVVTVSLGPFVQIPALLAVTRVTSLGFGFLIYKPWTTSSGGCEN